MTLELAWVRTRRGLTQPFANARRRWSERESLQIALRHSSGLCGEGEAAPLPGYSDETLADVEHAFAALQTQLPSLDQPDPQHLCAALEALPPLPPSARFALETAAFDLLAQRRGEPLHATLQFLGEGLVTAPSQGQALAMLVDVERAESEADAAFNSGYSTLKLKLGTPVGIERELAALELLRRRFGFDFRLRLDANQSFTLEQARALLPRLAQFAPEFVEEPCDNWRALEAPEIPIALDESLRRLSALDTESVTRHNVRALVLKPTVLGGFLATWQWVERARALDVHAIVSHTFEGSCGYRALTQFVLSLGSIPTAQGLGPHGALAADARQFGVRDGKLWAA